VKKRSEAIALVCGLLALLTFGAMGGVRSNGFVLYDDEPYVTSNAHVLQGLNAETVAWAFTTTECSNWHPLTWLSHATDVQLYGLNAGAHHTSSLVIHALNAILLFLLFFRLTGVLWPSALAAGLFAVHPLHVESVAWAAERKDVLSTLFWLLTLLAWVRYVRTKTLGAHGLAVLLFVFGLMAKPMLVTLPFTMLLLDFWPLRREATLLKLLKEKAVFFGLSAASVAMTLFAQHEGGAIKTFEAYPLAERLANGIVASVTYLGKTVWPVRLAVFYPYEHTGHPSWAVAGATILLAAITAIAIRSRAYAPYLAFGWFWYLGTLVPVIGLVQIGSQAMADRYTYVPLIGIFIATAWALAAIAESVRGARYPVVIATCLGLAVLAAASRAQVATWRDNTTLFRRALAVTSNNALAHNNLAAGLMNEERLGEAIEHCREALRIKPDYFEAHSNLGLLLAKTGRMPEAVEQFRQAVAINPDSEKVHNNLAVACAALSLLDESAEHFREVIRLNPRNTKAHDLLGQVLALQGRVAEAVAEFEEAIRLKPDYDEAREDLARAKAAFGDTSRR
jgi:tetratricopeptide (TPR) repeat protein